MQNQKKQTLNSLLLEASNIIEVADRIKFLQQNDSNALRTYLKIAYDTTLIWLVPEGAPSYKIIKDSDMNGYIYSKFVLRLLRMFFKNNGYDNLTEFKRQKKFVEFLESISQEDAELLIFIKDNKKMPFKKISKSFVRKCFPNLLEDDDSNDEKTDESTNELTVAST